MGKALMFSVALLLVAGCALPARTVAVAPGGDDNAAGTTQAPLATIQHAIEMAQPGDTVTIAPGVYDTPLRIEDKHGTRSEVLRIVAEEGAVIDLQGREGPAVQIRRCEWVVLEGLFVRNVGRCWGGIVLQDCRNCRISNCLVATGSSVGIMGSTLADCYITHNVCLHNDAGIYIGGGSTHNIIEGNLCAFGDASSENADGIASSDSRANIYRYNVAYHNNDDGIDMWTSVSNLLELNFSARNGDTDRGDGNGFKLGGHWGDKRDVVWFGGHHLVRWNVSANNMHTGYTNNGSTGNQFEGNAAFGNGTGWQDVQISGGPAEAAALMARIRAYWQRQIAVGRVNWQRAMREYPREFSEALKALGIELASPQQ